MEHYTRIQQGAGIQENRFQTLCLQMDSAWKGQSVGSLDQQFGVLILLVHRNGSVFRPESSCVLEEGDELTVLRK